ncbi:hypothetical protein NLI96_g4131 [Meripilus lineatus]|uniref:Uncharacterized protein n=1 Tax=Meripilus lineatus TaxID=2056292 RepID=A0AAD5V5S4_9APHY|nr:hypothetical protein NLI96_g4131 [Physisporinus lineatus]
MVPPAIDHPGNNPEHEPNPSPRRRQLNCLVQGVSNFLKGQNEKPQSPASVAVAPYKKAARWIPRVVSPFTDFPTVFRLGMRADIDPEFDNGANLGNDIHITSDPAVQEKHLQIYRTILTLVPGFSDMLTEYQFTPESLPDLLRLFDILLKSTRSDDIKSIRNDGISYLHKTPHTIITPRIRLESGTRKDDRGWDHLLTARLMCPLKLLQEYEADPERFCRRVMEGEIVIRASDLPVYLFPEGTVYNPNALTARIFQGHVIVRVYRHIFTSPASVWSPGSRTKGRKSKGDKHQMNRSCARSIAYAALQARHMMSSVEQWSDPAFDGTFSYEQYYNNLCRLLETNPDLPWVKETLRFYDREVFLDAGNTRNNAIEELPEGNDIDAILGLVE